MYYAHQYISIDALLIMEKCIRWLALRPTIAIVLLALIIQLAVWYVAFLITPWYEGLHGPIGGPDDEFLNMMPLVGKILLAVFLGPLLETAIFQLLIIFLLQRYTQLPIWMILCISSLLFASTHYYSIFYFVYALLSGFILSTFFMACRLKKGYQFGFLVISIIHGLYNSMGFFID